MLACTGSANARPLRLHHREMAEQRDRYGWRGLQEQRCAYSDTGRLGNVQAWLRGLLVQRRRGRRPALVEVVRMSW